MKAIVAHGPKDLRIEERGVPEPAAGQVLIRLAAGGIFGSDLHYYNHGGFGTVRLREPMILGHEVSGHIEALGAGVSGLKVGQLVAVSPSRPCHDCAYCHEGRHNHCLNIPAMRPGCVIVQLGLGGDMSLPVQAMTAKELQLRGSFRFHAEFFEAVGMMRKGRLDVRPLITQTMPLSQAIAAFDIASDRNRAVKAHIAFA